MEITRINRGQDPHPFEGKKEVLAKGHLLFSSSSKYAGSHRHQQNGDKAAGKRTHTKRTLTHAHTHTQGERERGRESGRKNESHVFH